MRAKLMLGRSAYCQRTSLVGVRHCDGNSRLRLQLEDDLLFSPRKSTGQKPGFEFFSFPSDRSETAIKSVVDCNLGPLGKDRCESDQCQRAL